MKEIIDIVAAYDKALKQGIKTAMATVVLIEGSAYRRAGARMLIAEDGQLTGAISGGCLEGDALRKARMVILQQEALLVTYDTMDDDNNKLGIGLGCNGIIHILIEPINASTALICYGSLSKPVTMVCWQHYFHSKTVNPDNQALVYTLQMRSLKWRH